MSTPSPDPRAETRSQSPAADDPGPASRAATRSLPPADRPSPADAGSELATRTVPPDRPEGTLTATSHRPAAAAAVPADVLARLLARPPARPPADATADTRSFDPDAPPAGPPAAAGQIGEFLLVHLLGKGAFGEVYLALQTGLGCRPVALKVMRAQVYGEDESQALAKLDHDHIVQLYSAFTDAESNAYCLCLQYVPGVTLKAVVQHAHHAGAPPASGRAVLDAVEAGYQGEVAFDPAALRERDALAADDFAQAVCRVGGRLAEALAFAHARGVLHCDVKPANILVTPYGRPMLADFNVAFHGARRSTPGSGVGGTLLYMAPEHQDAFFGRPGGRVDERCDVYSLGVVLFELATGHAPPMGDAADKLAPLDRVPRELAAVVRRALDPDPARRYESAAAFANALGGAWALIAARRALPPGGRSGGFVARRPFRALVFASLVPQFLASALNISYNMVEIELTLPQEAAFAKLVPAYNLLVYPVLVTVGVYAVLGLYRRLPLARTGAAADDARRRALGLGWWLVGLAAVGWLPGAVLFPLGIDLLAGGVGWAVYAHFGVSFVLSWLVAVVFSFLGVQAVVLRAFVPNLGNPDAYRPDAAWAEVRPAARLIGPCVVLATAVPLTGAALLVTLADASRFTLGFRLLAAGLIGLGMAGVMLAGWVAGRVSKLAAVWESAPTPPFGRGLTLAQNPPPSGGWGSESTRSA